MSLTLPYFKMDVIDWLKSEKIEQMSTPCVGAYIFLLCEAWTRPSCSLPSARLALMKLARWTGTEEELSPVFECFEPLRGDKTRVINPRLKREWDETNARLLALSEAGKRGAQMKQERREKKSAPSKRVRTDHSHDFEQFWNTYPNKVGKKAALIAWNKASDKPALNDIIQSLAQAHKTDQWTKENGKYIPNPATWLNQGRWSDQPLSNGHGHTLTCDKHPHLTFPDKKAKDLHDFTYHPKYVG